MQGLGIMKSPTFYVGELIREGRLHAVLADYKIAETSVYAVYSGRKYLSPKARAFIEFLAQRFGPEPYWDAFAKTDGRAGRRSRIEVIRNGHRLETSNALMILGEAR